MRNVLPPKLCALGPLVLLLALGACNGDDPAKPDGPTLSPADAARLVELENRGIALLEQYEYKPAIEPSR